MGTWQGPDDYDALLAIAAELQIADRALFVATMQTSGMLVRKPYYVPDIPELVGLMRELSVRVPRFNTGCRWVMCRETHDALVRRYMGNRVPAPVDVTAFFRTDAGAELPAATLEMEVLSIIESNRTWSDSSTMFGMPIRLDPAARSPLFELDSPATRI